MRTVSFCLLFVTALSPAFTLEEAVCVALSERGDVNAARESLRSSVWESRGADMWFLPSLSGQLAYVYNHDVQTMEIPGMGSIPMGTKWNSQYGLVATFPLFVPRGPSGSRLASRSREMSEWSLESTEQDAVGQVVEAFYGVLLAELMLGVSEEALQIAGEGYEIAMLKYNAGTISRFELLQSRVAFENRKPDAIAAGSALENATVGFSVSLGLDYGAMVVIEGDLFDPLPVCLPGTLEEAMEIMRAESPDLRVAESIEDLGEAGVSMARASLLPRLVARSDYSYIAAVDELGSLDPDDYHRSWSTSVSLEVPIFNGLTDIAGYNSARYERLAARAEARSLVQVTELALVQAWNSAEQAFEQLLATEATLALADEAAGIATVSYEAGMITRLEMDQAFLALTQARSNHASVLYSLRTAEARLARAMGILRIGEQK